MSRLRDGPLGGQNIYDPYFASSPLTRLSFIRKSNELLHKVSQHCSAKYLCMYELNPLRNQDGSLLFLPYSKVSSIIGEPYAESREIQIESFNSLFPSPPLVFLGLDLESKASSLSVSVDPSQIYSGVPYFALDCSGIREELLSSLTTVTTNFEPTRIELSLSHAQSSVYAQARSYLYWLSQNKFCSSCGSPTLPINGGTKLVCPPSDAAFPSHPPRNCRARTGLHNVAFPRTDPTLIAAPISADGRRVLLGRGQSWPEGYFSCISGFIEPAENMESATRREVWEESGVKVADVTIHSSQAWPYPSTLLVGTIGVCDKKEDEAISYPEKELGEARWFGLGEVQEALDHGHAMWEEPPRGWTGLRLPSDKLMAHRVLRGAIKLFGRAL